MIQRIAVMGAGSLGTILGAYLSKAGRDVVLIDAYQAHVDALNQNGAHITGAVEMTVPVKAITPEQMEGQYDLFFYLAKQTYNDVAIPQMMAHMGEGSVICTGQNGLPERAVSKAVGVHHLAGLLSGDTGWTDHREASGGQIHSGGYVPGPCVGEPDGLPLDQAAGQLHLQRTFGQLWLHLWRCAGRSESGPPGRKTGCGVHCCGQGLRGQDGAPLSGGRLGSGLRLGG
ncbi:MAG: hypothetical protein KH361_06830 [Clostridiales bacterium]|nr:hypothetical protein [Clostridiales bacterium]